VTTDATTTPSQPKRKAKGRKSQTPKVATSAKQTNGTTQHANGSAKPTSPERKAPIPYSEAVADIIVNRLREGESLLSICQSDDLPSESAVRQWAADPSHPFAANYARAREVGYLKMADEVIALSDGLDAGDSRFEPGVVQRHRLMVDSRKWILSKALPKIYGDRIDARLADANGEPLQIQATVAVRALLEAMPELLNGKVIDVELAALAFAAPPAGEAQP
jgi:hypothetical protein